MASMVNNELVPGLLDATFRTGDHICGFYRDRAEFENLVANYIGRGLQGGQRCCSVVAGNEPGEFVQGLERKGVNCTEHLRQNQLRVYLADEFYTPGGRFDPDATLTRFETEMGRSEADGMLLRVMGEMAWVARQVPGTELLLAYEARLNDLMPRYRQVTLCLYDAAACGGEMVIQLLRTHPKVLLNGAVISNPYYVPPDMYLSGL